MSDAPEPIRIVNAVAPIRICDNGGWTDTWFAEHGNVFNIAVHPSVQVQIRLHPLGDLPGRVVLNAENYDDRYAFDLSDLPGRHPLLEATIDEISLPEDVSAEITIRSEVPAGSSTGTSASVTVALIGALDSLTPGRMGRHEVACAAHRIEVERLGFQSGIQDQLCAAYGGINYIEVSAYPDAVVTQLSVPDSVLGELERRLVLVFLGRSHVSSEVHTRVISTLEQEGGDSPHLEELRRCAERAKNALCAADFTALGQAMIDNTEAQKGMHDELVGPRARAAIETAAAHGAVGWKVNGAGGDSGSITLLCGPDMGVNRELLRAIRATDAEYRVIPTHLSREGLRVWPT